MMDEISPELFERLVDLAAFAFDPAEAGYLRQELNHQLIAIHQLEAAPLVNEIPLASHGVSYPPETKPELRQDVWEPFKNPDAILAQAPQVADGFLIVPDIPHTELD